MRAVKLRRRPAAIARRLRPRTAAQAFVEFALAAPFVLLLVVGAAQVGAIAYGMVSTDTAAREGARYGSQHPLTSLLPAVAAGGTYQCDYAVDNQSMPGGNPICQAVYRAHGLLDATKFTIVISTNVPLYGGSNPFSLWSGPSDVVRIGTNAQPSPTPLPCGSDAEVDGSISFSDGSTATQQVQVTANGQGTVPSATIQPGSTTYRLCLAVHSHVQTINAVMGPFGCGGYAGQASVNIESNNGRYTPNPNPLVLSPNPCPTPTPSPSPTPTPTPTALPSGTPLPTDSPPPAFTCDNSSASPSGYFTVSVSYPVPIFVPLLGAFLGDSGNSTQRSVHATVTERIEPCAITGNQ